MDWSKLPDLAAVTLLTIAFASVARHSRAQFAGVWLIGWLMIVLHFAACMFLSVAGCWGVLASFAGLVSLAAAGILFLWASVPCRMYRSSRRMLIVLLSTTALYLGLLTIYPAASWALAPSAILIGALPLTVAFLTLPKRVHPLCWTVAILYGALAIFLLLFQYRTGNGANLALNAIFFTIYLGSSIHSWYIYRRATAGAFITIAGFFAWASVFVLGPSIAALFPHLHIDDEVWNLPKYVVAVGMILLLLEDQIEHNKYLALHDELTGLPNRRLFRDRLIRAIERARRNGAQVALLLVDLDHFKEVNDTIGHHAGDELLKRVSDLFMKRVRRSDTVARTGGDEFSVILEGPTSREDAQRVGRSLVQLLDHPFKLSGHAIHIGASVGVAIFPDDATDEEALCIAADLRMYAGKRASKKAMETDDLPTQSQLSALESIYGDIRHPARSSSSRRKHAFQMKGPDGESGPFS